MQCLHAVCCWGGQKPSPVAAIGFKYKVGTELELPCFMTSLLLNEQYLKNKIYLYTIMKEHRATVNKV